MDETLDPGPLPEAVARLALRKARAVAGRRRSGLVLGADTIVVIDGEALGKPSGRAEAAAMLRRLRGRAHEVMTGVAVIDAATGGEAAETVISRVTMRAYSEVEIARYVASDEPEKVLGDFATYRPITAGDLDVSVPEAPEYVDYHVLRHANRVAISNSTLHGISGTARANMMAYNTRQAMTL